MRFGRARTLTFLGLLHFMMPDATQSQNNVWYTKLTDCISTHQDTFFLHASDLRVLALDESAVLRTYLAGYQIQPDSIWLNRAIFHIQTILKATQNPAPDKIATIKNTRQMTAPGTSEPVREFYEACLFIPILRFYLQLIKTPPANPRYLAQFADFVKSIEQKTLANWKQRQLRWEEWPHHQYAALGTVFCLLHRLTQLPTPPLNHPEWQDWYYSTGLEMAVFLKEHLKIDTQTAAYYWYLDTSESRIENINQGNFTIEFILAAKGNGMQFDDIDLFRLLNTLRYKIWNQDEVKPEFRYCVDGSYSPDSGFQLQTWVFFSLLDLRLQQALHKNLCTWLADHPLLQGQLRGGKATCTVANLAFVQLQINTFQSEPVH